MAAFRTIFGCLLFAVALATVGGLLSTPVRAESIGGFSDDELMDGFQKTVFGVEYGSAAAGSAVKKFDGAVRLRVVNLADKDRQREIAGFVTRGKGVSIHRIDCRDYQNIANSLPDRVVAAEWGDQSSERALGDVYPIDLAVEASDRQGLLRDISEILSHEKLNVVSVNTLSKSGRAFMRFTVEVRSAAQVQKALTLIGDVEGVEKARRA